MAKDSTKTGQASRRSRQAIHRPTRQLPSLAAALIRDPALGYALLACGIFVLLSSVVVVRARESLRVAPQRVARETHHARVGFSVIDEAATEARRREAEGDAPRIYVEEPRIAEIMGPIAGLPETLAAATDLDSVVEGVRSPFGLNQRLFTTIQGFAQLPASEDAADDGSPQPFGGPGSILPVWTIPTQNLARALREHPVISNRDFQLILNSGTPLELRLSDGETVSATIIDVIDAEATPIEALSRLVSEAGFPDGSGRAVVNYLSSLRDERGRFPTTFRFDDAETAQQARAIRARVPDVLINNPAGSVLIARGQTVTDQAISNLRAEREAFHRTAPLYQRWLPRVSLAGAVAAVAAAVAGYAALFNRRIRRNPDRMLGLAVLLFCGLAAATVGVTTQPELWGIVVIAPTLLVTSILVIAYDQRTALAIGSLHALLVCVALDEPVGTFAIILTGLSATVWTLFEIRERRTIMRSGLVVALVLTVTTAAVSFVDRPIPQGLEQLIVDAALAGLGGLVSAAVTLALVTSVERVFDITTGMTLIELRDPKHPLLRELQQRAPGTYNHSLNVASIAEQAADSIGADGLLTYVGALYHDVGKMNKPEYFIENQAHGENRHDNLSPAMSLLVIVGHVKDGVELAREFQVPRPLHHFIEAHHGTTLVEYFFHRAVEEAETDVVMGEPSGGVSKGTTRGPDEFDYRYPGPKPSTREVAILMLSDAVESASRTLTEPTPARIENLVKSIARKRLDDGQFDECAITLRELDTVTDSIIKSMTAIHHGRIAYPSDAEPATRPA